MAFYVHVPFCAARCSYCDYPVVVEKPELAHRLVSALLAEARALRAALAAWPVAALYVGGGTPSRLPRLELRRLLGGLGAALLPGGGAGAGGGTGEAVEWTLEANPEDLDEELLQLLAAAGVNRLSVGAQTFDERLLRRLGRRCDAGTLGARLELLTRRWRGRLNVDLLAGIPGQRPALLNAAVDRVAALGIEHVTLLQLEEPPPGGLQPAADADELWLAGRERLHGHGYCQYEVTHFGRRGERSRYLRHALLLRPVAGVGPGAAGTLPAAAVASLYRVDAAVAAAAAGGALHLDHGVELQPYLAANGRGWAAAARAPAPAELLAAALRRGLRLAEGIAADPGWLTPPPARLLGPLWEEWERRGLAFPAGDRLALTPRGRLQLDRLADQAAARLAAAGQRPGGSAVAASWPAPVTPAPPPAAAGR